MTPSLPLGNFSLSLTVSDMAASLAFYEALGFTRLMGDAAHWQILKSGSTVLGLFKGGISKNTLTFNPGWAQGGGPLPEFVDVRELQRRLRAAGIEPVKAVDETTSGPGSFLVIDPDGNPVLFDQHV